MRTAIPLILSALLALPLSATHHDGHHTCCEQEDCCKDCAGKDKKHACCDDRDAADECCKNCRDQRCKKACRSGKCRDGFCELKKGRKSKEG